MAEPYLEQFTQMIENLELIASANVTLETKHFFSGAALYANGKISAILGPAGLAMKFPAELRQNLINEAKGQEFQFYEKGPIKREYVLLADAIVQDQAMLHELIEMSIRYADGGPNTGGEGSP